MAGSPAEIFKQTFAQLRGDLQQLRIRLDREDLNRELLYREVAALRQEIKGLRAQLAGQDEINLREAIRRGASIVDGLRSLGGRP